jgi:hypothetical protein
MHPLIFALAAYLSGHWNCASGAQTYTVDWSMMPGSLWLRGINRSTSAGKMSSSEDMQTYDASHRIFRIVDMQPNGAVSVLNGRPANSDHIVSVSVYPNATRRVRYDRISRDQYTLTFDFVINGKVEHWIDTCSRG